MNFMRNNWFYVGGRLFAVLAIILAIFWKDMGVQSNFSADCVSPE